MRKVQTITRLFNDIKTPEYRTVIEVLNPISSYLAIPKDILSKMLLTLSSLDQNSASPPSRTQMIHFQKVLAEFLLKFIILDAIGLYDGIRDIFLNHIPFNACDCLNECRSAYGCCHGLYTVEKIDYERIISDDLLTITDFSPLKQKFKLKSRNEKEKFCVGFDQKTKSCKIHAYKPMTCTKYPLMPSVHEQHENLTWKGACAHGDIWTTKISPFVTEKLGKLWMKANLLYLYQLNAGIRFEKKSIPKNCKRLIFEIIRIRRSTNIIDPDGLFLYLSHEFSKEQIQEALSLMREKKIKA